MNSKLSELLKRTGSPFKVDVALSKITYFRSGGSAEVVFYPETIPQLVELVASLGESKISFRVVGETSNILFITGKNYSCLISTIQLDEIIFDWKKGEIIVSAGAMLPELSRQALYKGVSGFAGLEGIPGTIGGAVFMNAGAYGDNIQRSLLRVEVVELDGSRSQMTNAELDFSYRDSVFKQRVSKAIVLKAYFKITLGDRYRLEKKMELVHSKRHKYHEYCYPNLGSIFSGSVYRALAKRSFRYRVVSSIFYLLNYRYKVLRREAPINRKWLNDYTVKTFGLKFETQPFSDKTINTIVNRGQSIDEIISYIQTLESLIQGDIPIENEIVDPF